MANRLAGMFAVWLLVLAVLTPAPAAASAAQESAFINQVNAARAQVGLPALIPDGQLTNLARGWAESMRDGVCGAGNHICHASPISAGVTHSWAKLGENVGTGPDVDSVMAAFIASPGHYANIIDPEFTHIGVGIVWEGDRMFTTHRFMKLQASQATTTVPPTTAVGNPTPPGDNTPTPVAPSTSTTVPADLSPDSESEPEFQPVRPPQAVLEERAAVLLDALLTTS